MKYEATVVVWGCPCFPIPLLLNCQRLLSFLKIYFYYLDLINKLLLRLENQHNLHW